MDSRNLFDCVRADAGLTRVVHQPVYHKMKPLVQPKRGDLGLELEKLMKKEFLFRSGTPVIGGIWLEVIFSVQSLTVDELTSLAIFA